MADDELTPPSEDTQDDQPDKDWQAEATKWKALARKHEKAAKDNADAARRLAEIEKSGKTEQERLAEARRTADERAVTPRREITSLTCHFAPARLMPSALAISGFVRPAATRRNTCCCRGVSLLDALSWGCAVAPMPKT
jgi:hypothetical protein